MKIVTILGTRPEITKLSALISLLDKNFDHKIIHTGQHYDYSMDKIFFNNLKIREPDYLLGIGSGSHSHQTSNMLTKIEEILIKEKPNIVIVQGDTNTTLAGALTASKMGIFLIHIEAGCRHFFKKLPFNLIPEELNMKIADLCSNLLLAPDEEAYNNLKSEGFDDDSIKLIGSITVDSVNRNLEIAKNSDIVEKNGLKKQKYIITTIHRVENTDNLSFLKNILGSLNQISSHIKIVFPMHPRTKKIVSKEKIKLSENILVLEPLGYLDFLKLLSDSYIVITDSGGVQEEAVILNVPCLIPREGIEWIRLVKAGKTLLVGEDEEKITNAALTLINDKEEFQKIKNIKYRFYDSHANVSEKIISIIKSIKIEG